MADEDEEDDDDDDYDEVDFDESGEDPPSDAIDDRVQYAVEMAREQMLGHAIQSIAETVGADMSELVHAMCSVIASCCVEASHHVTHHEQTVGTIFTHRGRLEKIVEEILEKIDLIEKGQVADAERLNQDSAGEGTVGEGATGETKARARRRKGTH